jgi:hypothetical protein
MVWFSYKQDTMYLPSNLIAKLDATVKRSGVLEIDFSKVKRLLLGQGLLFQRPLEGEVLYQQISKVIGWFGKLEHLTLASEDPGNHPGHTLVDF